MGSLEKIPRPADQASPPAKTKVRDLSALCRFVMDNSESRQEWLLAQVDIANLRAINTLFSYAAGDEIISRVALALAACAGFSWYRVHGGDWIGIAQGVPATTACATLRQLQADVSDHADAKARIKADISIGVACGSDIGELICMADLACRQAKLQGRGKLVLHPGNTARPSPILRALLTHKPLDGVIELYHQRVAHRDLSDHYEILSRARGLSVGPIMGLIEGMGLARDFDLGVLDMALREVPASAPIHAVNLSAATICDPAAMDEVFARLKGRRNIALEVTETAVMTAPDKATSAIARLRAEGHHVFLDDFGEGATSFGMLDMPFSAIKLGKALAGDLCPPDILSAVMRLARTRSLAVVAEMVETTEQFMRLLNAGVHGFQGYLIHRPERIALNRHAD